MFFLLNIPWQIWLTRLISSIVRMNNEILDYEITVLNKHEDENSLVRAEQKRKVIEDQQNVTKITKIMEDYIWITLLLKVMALQNTANKLKISVSTAKMIINILYDMSMIT